MEGTSTQEPEIPIEDGRKEKIKRQSDKQRRKSNAESNERKRMDDTKWKR